MENKSIYDLQLHERTYLDGFEITKVRGGWLYRFWNNETQDFSTNAIFVSYNT